MRLLLTMIIMVLFTALKAQTISPGFQSDIYTSSLYHNKHLYDSTATKKWFVSRSIGINAGYSFFNGGHASIISAPLSLQLNRRLNNNLYAFAGVSIAPSYISFSNAFLNTDLSKVNTSNNFFLKNIIFTISAVATYSINIPTMIPANGNAGTTKPRAAARGVNGNIMVITNATTLNTINNLPGILFNKDLCVRTTNNINNSVQIDSINQAV